MEEVYQQLLILMVVVWGVASLLRKIGFPTIMGELLMGVILGPAVLGWVEPNEIIEVLAQLGIFFLLLHTGVETEPRQFFAAVKVSLGVTILGAAVPFAVATGVGLAFGLTPFSAIFVGLTMTATAVVVALKIMRDLGLQHTRVAHVVMAAAVIDGLVSLIMFSVVLGIVREGSVAWLTLLEIAGKVGLFFGVVCAVGWWLYPRFSHPFRHRQGKGFAFLLALALLFGLFAEAIGLHIILGAYMAGLFLEERVAGKSFIDSVELRLNGIAYTLLGPIFFISLGFHVSFAPLAGSGFWFVLALAGAVAVGQVLSAAGMARLLRFSWVEAFGVGAGMCARAEMAYVLASLGLGLGVIDGGVFTVLICVTFLLNLVTPVSLYLLARPLRAAGMGPGEPAGAQSPGD